MALLARSNQVRSLLVGCLWWVAPPCSTWVFLSRGSTGRSFTRPRGWEYFEVKNNTSDKLPINSRVGLFCHSLLGSKMHRSVRRANRLIRRIIYVLLGWSFRNATCVYISQLWLSVFNFPCIWGPLRCEYLFHKGVHYCIENPMSTLLWTYRPMEASVSKSNWNLLKAHSSWLCACDPSPQEMLERHKARSISVPLGAFGAQSERLADNGNHVVWCF